MAWYNRKGDRPWLAAKIAEMTQADKLESGKAYPIHVINRYIPRGGSIEHVLGMEQPND